MAPQALYARCVSCSTIYPAAQIQFCPRDGSALVADPRILAGKFILLRKLGQGAMGEVWEADQPALARKVAVKLLHQHLAQDLNYLRRFEREARASRAAQPPEHRHALRDRPRPRQRPVLPGHGVPDRRDAGPAPVARAAPAAAAGAVRCGCQSPAPWSWRTGTAWCTATSSPRTSSCRCRHRRRRRPAGQGAGLRHRQAAAPAARSTTSPPPWG